MSVLFKNYDNNFLEPLRSAKTVEQLNHRFEQICHTHGIESFSIVELKENISQKETFSIYSTYPEKWVSEYVNKQYYGYDPVLSNSTFMPFPFYWHHNLMKNLTKQQQNLFKEAYSFGVRSGTTIPLIPTNKKRSYLTLLNVDVANNFDLMFWLRVAGDEYFNTKNSIL